MPDNEARQLQEGPAEYFNVICSRSRDAKQILVGYDGTLARKIASKESENLCKGESVRLWSINSMTHKESEMVCYG